MQNTTYKKLNYIKLTLVAILFFMSFKITAQNTITTGVSICKGESGELTATTSTSNVTSFTGYWNAATDPRAFIPESLSAAYLKNSPVCKFSTTASGNYTATTFKVNVSGTYNFKMTNSTSIDGMAYIFKGNFTPGTCSGGGTYIIGDDDYDGMGEPPRLITHLDAGVTYTLISTKFTTGNSDFVGDYTWTISGGTILLDNLNYWYTTSTGGNPIGWGNTFNPVGVPGSGLPDTNTAGTKTYYVSDGTGNSLRTPVNFTILEDVISLTCEGEMQTVLKDDFGSGVSDRGSKPSTSDFTTNYNFSPSGGVGPNSYSLMKNANQANSSWSSGGDHTTGKNGNGYMLVFDANTTLGSVFYEKKYSELCSGSLVTFSIYATNLISTAYQGYSIKPKVKIDLINPLNQSVIKSFTSDELQLSQPTELLWNELSLSFTIPSGLDTITVRVSNAQADTNTNGNDVAFDDVSFSICVPSLTISTDNNKVCANESVTLTAQNEKATGYTYQWQQLNGTNWIDIPAANSIQYKTPALAQTTTYRIRFAQTGVDISNNKNLLCSGSKEMLVEITPKPSPVITNVTINWGQNYTWPANGVSYNSSQSGLTIEKDNCTANQVLNLTVNPKVEGVIICKGGSGELTVTNSSQRVTQFSGYWNAATDPRAFFPVIQSNPKICSFINYAKGNYTATTFRVTQSGIYNLKMADQVLDGVAYIYSGNFTPGTCSGEGTYIIGDRNYDGPGTNPRLITYLDAGVTYTLVSTMYPPNYAGSTDFYGDYTWTVTTPSGGEFIIDTLNYWYTTSTGGNPIGWGNSFNPVGVAGSGLADTNTAGTTTYYVSNGIANSTRTPVDFTIKAKPTTISTPISICSGGSYTWSVNNETYTTAGTYSKINDGCTADQELILTIGAKPTTISTPISICSGESYTWSVNNETYTTAGTYSKINDGCTADQELVLTIGAKPTTISTTISICSGGSYTWNVNNETYKTAGTYSKINDGCTADQELVLTIGAKPTTISTPISICSGQSYTW
ncbi:MAG: hypothetical protein WAM46_09110, partial [Flavobacterium sp.]